MFNNDDELIREALINPEQVWKSLDSFWRDQVTAGTGNLVKFQSTATMLLELTVHARARYFLSGQTVPAIDPWLNLPWYPIVLYQDRLVDFSFVLYGDDYDYSDTPDIVYGQTSEGRWIYPLPYEVIDVPEIADQVIAPTVVIDKTQMSFDQVTGRLVFLVDPFTLIPAKTDAGSGRQYIILWVRNLLLDLNMPFDQAGWPLKYQQLQRMSYAAGLKLINELAELGPSIDRYQRGLMASQGWPYALAAEQVTSVDDDDWQWIISTANRTYTVEKTMADPVVVGGDELTVGQPLTDGIEFFEYPATLEVTAAQLPGLVLQVPLSTGVVAVLTFANVETEWTEVDDQWTFPVGGNAADVAQFWADVQTFATANSLDLETLYDLPAAVNPMYRIIEDLLQNSLFVASVDLAQIPQNPGTFADRARELLPQDILLVLQQDVGVFEDAINLETSTSGTVYYGYNAAPPTEIISISGGGTDLTYFDLTPLVVTY